MTRKTMNCITMINPCDKSLDDMVKMRVDYLRRGYMTEIRGEKLSENINIVKLVVYDKDEKKLDK